jgi:hypothetical protein
MRRGTATSRSRGPGVPKGRAYSGLANSLLLAMVLGGSLLAYRWNSPLGNITVARGALLLTIAAMGTGVIRLSVAPPGSPAALASSAALLLIVIGGVLYTPAPPMGIVVVANFVEGVITLFVALLLTYNVVSPSRGHSFALSLARVPLWGYLPTGLLGVHQAFQLLVGSRPTIPFLRYARLDESTINSARTAFEGGLNEFGLDRVASAMGDPASYGIFSAVVIGYCVWGNRRKLLERNVLFWASVMLASFGVILSASSAAVVVLAAVLLSNLPTTIVGWRRSILAVGYVSGTVALLIGVLPQAQGFLLSSQGRVTAVVRGEGSAGAHLSLLRDGWEVFSAYPLFGVGTGGFGFHAYGFDAGFSSVHNTLVLGLAEGGALLGLALILFWVTLWRKLVPHAMLLPVTAAWLVYLDFNRIPALWVILGLTSALWHWQRRQTKDADAAVGIRSCEDGGGQRRRKKAGARRLSQASKSAFALPAAGLG